MAQHQSIATGGGHTSDQGSDRRWEPRKSCGYRALIKRPKSGTEVPCSIVDMSTTGACLELTDSSLRAERDVYLPAYFTLSSRVDRIEIDCAIVWRDGARVGVRFLSASRSVLRLSENR